MSWSHVMYRNIYIDVGLT